MFLTTLAIVTAAWGILMAVAPLLQVRRIVAVRSSRGISIGYFSVLLIGFVLWLAYGIAKHDPTLIVPNGVALCVSVSVIGVAARFRHAE